MKKKQAKKKFKALAKAAYDSMYPHIRKIKVDFAPKEEKGHIVVVASAYPSKRTKVRVSKALMTQQNKKMKEQETLVDPKRIPDTTRILTNLAYMMGDVTNTLMMDAEFRVKQLGFNLKYDCKRRLKQAVEDTARAKRSWQAFAAEMYQLKDAEQACDDSDFFADIVLLIADRVGDNGTRQEMVRKMIYRLKSQVNIYEQLKYHK